MDVDALKKSDILRELKEDMLSFKGGEDERQKLKDLHNVIEELDLSVLETTGCENTASSSTAKRRKTTRSGSESNDEQFLEKQQKDSEETDKQNKLVKKPETNDCESATSPSTPKRRKSSRAGSESTDAHLSEKQQKDMEDIAKQIKLVKKALNIVYDMEGTSFRKFISKNGKKCRNVVSRVPFIRRIKENGKLIPLWVGSMNERPPPLCGAVEAGDGYVADVGDMVAALVTQNKKENWILAEVVSYDHNRREYRIDDIYENSKAEQNLDSHKVIPLPKWRADPDSNPEALFPKHSLVLALYPGTTCFYRAIVDGSPLRHEDPYQLLFEDDSYTNGYSSSLIPVHQRYVVSYGCYGNEEESDK